MQLTAKRLESGYWHIRGTGIHDFAQPPTLTAPDKELLESTMPEASKEFKESLLKFAQSTALSQNECRHEWVTIIDDSPLEGEVYGDIYAQCDDCGLYLKAYGYIEEGPYLAQQGEWEIDPDASYYYGENED